MIAVTPVHPEGPRYAASLMYLPGLWVGPRVWQRAGAHLGHRGWQGAILDVRSVAGGLEARARAVADYARTLAAPPVVVGYDAGALVAIAAAVHVPLRAIVLVSPLRPGAPATHALAWSRGLVWSLLRRASLPPPPGSVGDAFLAGLPPELHGPLGCEDARALAALARRSDIHRPEAMPPTLVVHAADDPFSPAHEARRLAAELGADVLEAPGGGGHWPLTVGAWQASCDGVHRWLVQRLSDADLELYAEAMADRDDADEG